MVDKCLKLNKQDVSAEVIDGEAIIINVATGVYYSIEDVGAYIWDLLTSEHSLEQIPQALISRYHVSADRARKDLEDFVQQLVEEDLMVEIETAQSPSWNGVSTSGPVEDYRKPELNIYRDMGDLLALDPPTPGITLTPWEAESDADSLNTDE